VPSLEGEVLENFSLKVARTWALGRKGQNDGILFLIAKSDRKLRIEVGHGLEGTIPDALAGRIINNEVTPRFRSGDFDGGVVAGVDAIIQASQGAYTPTEHTDTLWTNFAANLVIGTILFFTFGACEGARMITPGVGWFLYFALTSSWAYLVVASIGSINFFSFIITMLQLVAFPIIKFVLPRTPFGRMFHSDGKKIYFGSILIMEDGGAGGYSGGGSSGGSDFSGGGGSFGGGGSSGSW
jgi:uncharacterized protein